MEISNPENHSGNWQELRQILKEKQFGKLFAGATENTLIQFFRYCFVGGAATVIDWCFCTAVFPGVSSELCSSRKWDFFCGRIACKLLFEYILGLSFF